MSRKAVRPGGLQGQTHCKETGCGKLYVTVNAIDGAPFEVFTHMGKAAGCVSAQREWCFLGETPSFEDPGEKIGRLISYSLRVGGDMEEIIKKIKGIRCHQPLEDVLSCSDAVGQVLEKYCLGTHKSKEGTV